MSPTACPAGLSLACEPFHPRHLPDYGAVASLPNLQKLDLGSPILKIATKEPRTLYLAEYPYMSKRYPELNQSTELPSSRPGAVGRAPATNHNRGRADSAFVCEDGRTAGRRSIGGEMGSVARLDGYHPDASGGAEQPPCGFPRFSDGSREGLASGRQGPQSPQNFCVPLLLFDLLVRGIPWQVTNSRIEGVAFPRQVISTVHSHRALPRARAERGSPPMGLSGYKSSL